MLGIKTEDPGQPAYYVAGVRAARRLRDRSRAGLLSRGHRDSRRAGLPHGRRHSRRRRHGQRLSPPAATSPPHVDDILAKKPKSVWFQLGIRNDDAAERLARAGIDVVQDRCLMVELGRSVGSRRSARDSNLVHFEVDRHGTPARRERDPFDEGRECRPSHRRRFRHLQLLAVMKQSPNENGA